ncbi:MAG: hypothetical protein HKO56_03755 [Bacteroidia bacterium]|nr:metallophosphoesterase [Bacteroidia bacterium]NNM15752.1 hypothetical protein [Bacteroidia bacterium]
MNIDFIGDIHGHHSLLEKLLIKLEYTKSKGCYTHPVQKTIFVGDIINRGPKVRESLELVFNMWKKGQARCILGNHEINFLAYQLHQKKPFLAAQQVQRIEKQLEHTLISFKNHKKELEFYTDWIKSWPSIIDEKGYRVVHACWIQKGIDFFKERESNSKINNDLLVKLMDVGTKEYGLLHSLYQGVDIPYFKEGDNTKSTAVRIRWWDSMANKTYRDMATKERQRIPEEKIPAHFVSNSYQYNDKPLLFVGHFCLDELPHLVSDKVCCLDFCVSKKGILTAYRYLAEKKLKAEHLYFVHN